MGLVDYGSDSDSDSGSPPQPAKPSTAPATASSASTSLLKLPPPKSSMNLPAPKSAATGASATAPQPSKKTKDKGPVRILLDLPPPSASSAASGTTDESGEPAKKRPKLSLGNGGGLTGLAAMLPKPKNESKAPPPPPKPAPARPAAGLAGLDDLFGSKEGTEAASGSNGASTGPPGGLFVPPSVAAKGKGKAPAAASSRSERSAAPAEPAVDFFGIGSVATPAASSSSSSTSTSPSKPSLSISSAPSLSAAPSVSSAPNLKSSATSAPSFGTPTASDPYPGFTRLPSGEWVAKDQQTYEMWTAWMAQQQQQGVPEGLDAKDVEARGGMVDINEEERRAREAWANRPGQVPPSKVVGGDEKTSAQLKGVPKQIGGMARRKGQLSSLLAAAHDNRAELEERIAQARANRKGAGSKYGF